MKSSGKTESWGRRLGLSSLIALLAGCATHYKDSQGARAMLLVASAGPSPIKYQIEQADQAELALRGTSASFKMTRGFRQPVIEVTSKEPFLFKVDSYLFVYACSDGYYGRFANVRKKDPHFAVTLGCPK